MFTYWQCMCLLLGGFRIPVTGHQLNVVGVVMLYKYCEFVVMGINAVGYTAHVSEAIIISIASYELNFYHVESEGL